MTRRRAASPNRFLLDTNVISEPSRPRPDARVLRRLGELQRNEVYLSSVTIGELTYGVERLSGRRQEELRRWLDELKRTHERQILPFDTVTAEAWGRLAAECDRRGKRLPTSDAQIAAVALQHELTLLTRNTADFEATGVLLENPWSDTSR